MCELESANVSTPWFAAGKDVGKKVVCDFVVFGIVGKTWELRGVGVKELGVVDQRDGQASAVCVGWNNVVLFRRAAMLSCASSRLIFGVERLISIFGIGDDEGGASGGGAGECAGEVEGEVD